MKKMGLVLSTVLMIVALSACALNQTEDLVVDGQPSMFVKVEDGPSWNVYYHNETKVMYVVSMSSYNCGNFTVLVNADGTPMLYEGE